MKYLITICLILMSTSVLPYEMPIKSVNLDKKKVYIQDFTKQKEEESTHNQILLRRTTGTPSKVQLGFAIMTNEDVCVRYQRTNVFRREKDYYYSYNRNSYYLVTNVCVEFKNQSVGYNKWITLDFDNAKKLEKDDQELIRFSFAEDEDNTDVIDFNAEIIGVAYTGEGYTIDTVEESFFRNQGLSFTYQPQVEIVRY